jgi:hypothetical protein
MTAGAKGVERLGAGISELGMDTFDAIQRIQERQQKVDVLSGTNQLERELIERSTKIKGIVGNNVNDASLYTNSDGDKGKDLYAYESEQLPNIRKKYEGNLSPKALLEYNRRADEIEQGYLRGVATHQVTESRKYAADQVNASIDIAILNITEDPSPQNVLRQQDLVDKAISDAYPGQNVSDYRLHARSKLESHTKSIRASHRVTMEVIDLQRKHRMQTPDDPAQALLNAITEVTTPEYKEDALKRNLNENDQRRVEADLNAALVVQEKIYKDKREKVEEDLIQKLYKKQLVGKEFERAVFSSNLRVADQNVLFRLHRQFVSDGVREEREKRSEARQEWSLQMQARQEARFKRQEEYDTASAQGLKLIRNGTLKTTDDIIDFAIKNEDTKLVGELDGWLKRKNAEGGRWDDKYDVSHKLTTGVNSPNPDKDTLVLQKKIADLESKGMLHAEAVQQVHGEYMKNVTGGILDNISGPSKSAPTSKSNLPSKGQGHVIGEIVIKNNKPYKYIGNNKWQEQ